MPIVLFLLVGLGIAKLLAISYWAVWSWLLGLALLFLLAKLVLIWLLAYNFKKGSRH